MHQDREDLDLLFRGTLPEKVLAELDSGCGVRPARPGGLVGSYDIDTYQHLAFGAQMEYSEDETAIRYRAMRNAVSADECDGIFALLYQYADNVLTKRDGILACRTDEILGWNSITKRLGQDLFTTSWLAHMDCEWAQHEEMHQFTWQAVLPVDDIRLNGMLKKGTAENHFHLHGSTQSFALSWASLMNHPGQIRTFLREEGNFKANRNIKMARGESDNVFPWEERLVYASMIRALLFEKIVDNPGKRGGQSVEEAFREMDHALVKTIKVQRLVERLRNLYGVRFRQPSNTYKCLDYAICEGLYAVRDTNHNRLLAGERAFLYKCFLTIYQQDDSADGNAFSAFEKELFYLYLLIKHNFRSELIQVNHKTGFYNFAKYQDRKNQFFIKYEEYFTEAQRLAVVSAIHENYIESFETRIMVRKSRYRLWRDIKTLDQCISFPERVQNNVFYVTHFPKKAFTKKEFSDIPKLCQVPRNVDTRNHAESCARVLRGYLMMERGAWQRVLGIDACSNEIGCRPETFATEFRYLRKVSELGYNVPWYRSAVENYEELGITYHAGEDFLDIADGIRAVDEAMTFLEMRSGDRLGHAIALGIAPIDYYRKKRMTIYLTKQDYLDDLVWLLYRSLEWNVFLEADHREEMRRKARELFSEIYESRQSEIAKWHCGDILDIYYDSWKLRGDHPRAYCTGEYKRIDRMRLDPYERFMVRGKDDKELRHLRQNKLICLLYYWYHYDAHVKEIALSPERFEVSDWYIYFVSEMQKALRGRIAARGIGIECNPTSNVLISSFVYYSKHPVLVFNRHHISGQEDEPNLWVSINTDDIGVFDTSLTNEYALLFRAVIRQRHQENKWNDEVIYEYLDSLRQNGLDMAFKNRGWKKRAEEAAHSSIRTAQGHWWD